MLRRSASMCAASVSRVAFSALLVSLFGCRAAELTPPHQLTADDLIGSYDLTSIAWGAAEPFRPLPTWTWPGRVLVLNGSIEVGSDGHYVSVVDFWLTMLFGETTFSECSATGFWTI